MFLTQVMLKDNQNENQCFLALTQKNIIFLSEGLEETLGIINYMKIKIIKIDSKSNFYLEFDLLDNEFFRNSIFIATEDRKSLLTNIQTCFRADQMSNKLRAIKIPIITSVIPNKLKDNFQIPYFRYPVMSYPGEAERKRKRENDNVDDDEVEQPFLVDYIKNYSVLLPSSQTLEPDSDCIYRHRKANDDFFVSIQISDDIPLNSLKYFGRKSVLEYYTHEVLFDWMEYLKRDYWIKQSMSYPKRFNLNDDIAQWTGW